jgi:hypothetical protein
MGVGFFEIFFLPIADLNSRGQKSRLNGTLLFLCVLERGATDADPVVVPVNPDRMQIFCATLSAISRFCRNDL